MATMCWWPSCWTATNRDWGLGKPRSGPIPNPKSPIPPRSAEWRETPMTMVAPGTDRWTARFDGASLGWHAYQIVAWIDRFLTWRRDIRVKAAAGQDVSVELLQGSLLVRDTANRADDADAAWLL